MKKIIAILLIGTVIFTSAISVFAGQIPKVNINEMKIILRNSPFIEGGRTYIPLRSVSENLGCNVSWNQATKTATIIQNPKTIEMSIGSNVAMVNNKPVEVDATAKLVGGVTYVPVRFISEVLGGEVNYTKDSNTIDITYEKPTDAGQQYDYWGRLIRTTNLPARADQYKYIVDGVPNELYDCPFCYEEDLRNGTWVYTWVNDDGTKGSRLPVFGEDYKIPKDYNMTKYDNEYTQHDAKIRKVWMDWANKYMDSVLNIDYKTANENTINSIVANLLTKRGEEDDLEQIETYKNSYKDYVKNLKDNNINLVGDFTAEPSIVYRGVGTYMRGYFKFMASSDKVSNFSFNIGGNKETYKTNTWYQGTVDIGYNASYFGDMGYNCKPGYFEIQEVQEMK